MEQKNATEAPAIAPANVVTTTTPTETVDMETRFKQLEEEKENYKKAYLKADEKLKNKASEKPDEGEDEKIDRKVKQALADSRLADIAREQDEIIQKTLKRNKELELALLNKTTTSPSGAIGTHSESQRVTDTSVTPEQLDYFKNTLKWSDKEIERYKTNLRKKA